MWITDILLFLGWQASKLRAIELFSSQVLITSKQKENPTQSKLASPATVIFPKRQSSLCSVYPSAEHEAPYVLPAAGAAAGTRLRTFSFPEPSLTRSPLPSNKFQGVPALEPTTAGLKGASVPALADTGALPRMGWRAGLGGLPYSPRHLMAGQLTTHPSPRDITRSILCPRSPIHAHPRFPKAIGLALLQNFSSTSEHRRGHAFKSRKGIKISSCS